MFSFLIEINAFLHIFRCVVLPYQEFPSLLELLLSFLKTEQLVSIRRETLRVLGLLGALDPYKHKMNLGHIDSQVRRKLKELPNIACYLNRDFL
jgi:FKBP12-rapamycin complex-associated protein